MAKDSWAAGAAAENRPAGELQSANGNAALTGRSVFPRVPFTRLLGVTREFAEGGRARMSVDIHEDLTNLHNAAHGGVILTLIDVAMASAAMSKVDFTKSLVTLDLS
ncbi:MAG TPA: PaaI family thioesterase, partial [Burkholderiaceae bacterium]|nr:PaaI family thioesterase [Burkholderiaceae bacterium]